MQAKDATWCGTRTCSIAGHSSAINQVAESCTHLIYWAFSARGGPAAEPQFVHPTPCDDALLQDAYEHVISVPGAI